MRFRGWIFILTALLLVHSEAQALNTCSRLFASAKKQYPNKTVERINFLTSVPFEDVIATIAPNKSLSEAAHFLGQDFVKERALYIVHAEEIKRKFNNREILELGDSLIENAKKFLKEAQITYYTKKAQVGGVSRSIIVISPRGNHSLNQEVKFLEEKYGTKTIYNPYELLRNDAEGMFLDSNTLLISELMMANGSLLKDAIGIHELTHLKAYVRLKQKVAYPLYGELTAISGILPGKSKQYSKYQSIDELDAMLKGAQAGAQELIQLNKIKNDFRSELEARKYKAMIIARFRNQIESGLELSQRLQKISKENLENLDRLFDSQNIKIRNLEDGVWSLAWSTKTENIFYNIEIPVLITKENPTLSDFKKALLSDLESKYKTAIKCAETFRKALHEATNLESITLHEALPTLHKLQEILSEN